MGCVSSSEKNKADTLPAAEDKHLCVKHFKFKRVLGKGGYGTVYHVSHIKSKREFALKFMDKKFLLERSLRLEQAKSEKNVMARVGYECTFLLPLYCAFQDLEGLYLIMPAMYGGDLSNFVQNVGLMPEDMCRFYAAEIIMGLKFLNERSIIFRDLKPSNILMDRSGHIKISDYGLAVDISIAGAQVDLAGTAGYIAPEVLLKQPLSPAVDVWTLGVTMYKLMTGHRPFKTTRSLMTDDVPWTGVARKFQSKTVDLLEKLMMKDPEKRLGSGERGWKDIQDHPFFIGIQWDTLHLCKAPWSPLVKPNNMTTANEDAEIDRTLTEVDQANFEDWDLNTLITPENAFIWDVRSPDKSSSEMSASPPTPSKRGRLGSTTMVSVSVEPPRVYKSIHTNQGTGLPNNISITTAIDLNMSMSRNSQFGGNDGGGY